MSILGAIAGDVIGMRFERFNRKSKEFALFSHVSRFTDDTVLTLALADALTTGQDFAVGFRGFGLAYPDAGYGGTFRKWLSDPDMRPYGSYGNGAAMRVSPVAYAFHTEKEVLASARASAAVTHSHPEGIKGAEAIALAVFLARMGQSRDQILRRVVKLADYDLDFTLDDIRPTYRFDVSCQGSVPQALVAFREAADFEDAIRGAISIGGDSDTIACMAGAIAAPFFGGVPEEIGQEVRRRLDSRLNNVLAEFEARYPQS